MNSTGLKHKIASVVEGIDYHQADQLDRTTTAIRELVEAEPMPADVAEQVLGAYRGLGSNVYVAVRSSGTAEDLADASFAGLHDTYLDITGEQGVLDAVRRCWASLWTARAASYRNTRGFASDDNGIAVVVQRMVVSEVSGVMFSANPLTTATDEIVVNASWGLGEAIVGGIATPDQFVLHAGTLRIKNRTLGAKEVRVVRNPATGVGTVSEDVPATERERFSLTDDQLVELTELGRRVQRHYGEMPQDMEWGLAEGQFYLLQARPVTGVGLSWDSDVDAWQWLPEADDDTVWTRNWSDEVWTGAITPLMYSFRALGFTRTYEYSFNLWGYPELAQARTFRYYKGGAYFNSNVEKVWAARSAFPRLRPALVANVPPSWAQEILDAPFSLSSYLRMHARCALLDKNHGLTTWWNGIDSYVTDHVERANGLSNAELQRLSDAELHRYVEGRIRYEAQYITDVWSGFFIHARDVLGVLNLMVEKWYDGGEVSFIDLITGTPRPTATLVENNELWRLAREIKRSELLSRLFTDHTDGEFFLALEDSEEGRRWLLAYREFLERNGHRGHADRDIYFLRRAEDPSVDYRFLGSMLNADFSAEPEDKEREIEARRVAAVEKVVENLRRKPFGGLRVELFRAMMNYAMRFLMVRDDERHWVDRSTFTIKRCFTEMNRRIRERNLFHSDRDYFFLTAAELYSVLDGTANMRLIDAKIAGRMREFDAMETRTRANPMYLQDGRDVDHVFDAQASDSDSLQGMPTSWGKVEGVARVVANLKDIGRVNKGEILITNSTDPGWTPVFLLISGIVLETGGMLAHGSCLAREYGFPAVQLPKAMQLIPDGARISVNGQTGQVSILDEQTEPAELVPAGT